MEHRRVVVPLLRFSCSIAGHDSVFGTACSRGAAFSSALLAFLCESAPRSLFFAQVLVQLNEEGPLLHLEVAPGTDVEGMPDLLLPAWVSRLLSPVSLPITSIAITLLPTASSLKSQEEEEADKADNDEQPTTPTPSKQQISVLLQGFDPPRPSTDVHLTPALKTVVRRYLRALVLPSNLPTSATVAVPTMGGLAFFEISVRVPESPAASSSAGTDFFLVFSDRGADRNCTWRDIDGSAKTAGFCGYKQAWQCIEAIIASRGTPPLDNTNPNRTAANLFPSTVLLSGPTGVGKTLLLQALHAKHRDISHFFDLRSVSSVSSPARRILSDRLSSATRTAERPLLVLIDQVEAVLSKRETVACLAVELDLLLANHPHATVLCAVSGAMTEFRQTVLASRFRSVEIVMDLPNFAERAEIAALTLQASPSRNININGNDSKELEESAASMTGGLSGRDVVRLCRRQQALQCSLTEARSFLDQWQLGTSAAVSVERPTGDWHAVGGAAVVREALDRAIGYSIRFPQVYRRFFGGAGAAGSTTNGVLLHGPSGVGKTLCAEAFAAELWPRVSFIRVKTPLLQSKYVGDSEELVRQLFRLARQLAPSLLFFDELDAIGAARSTDSDTTGVHERIVASLLNEIDGVGHSRSASSSSSSSSSSQTEQHQQNQTVHLLACTNRLDSIDPALLRPGRFGTHIAVDRPDSEQRVDILRALSGRIRFDPEPALLEQLADKTEGCTGADLALLCQEAALKALTQNPDVQTITAAHFLS